ncbi:LPS export ABC transporter permease LptG [Desulfatitalea alkaliphila]|uniref:LPS export ABC transporter permease LptG n=1 Tax=Desulfatitalea alkaliphila TaxID=2929485 RepID=A0AA41UJ37_9BACT|nr:LPS export ABC transporter permease LptG [Desulfatitalea alkaliphila]MCJ8500744.1 LPS export ABC transporter permease LptG [Desulfatitalea alkaliphila]
MRIIANYLTREIGKSFAVILIAVIGIYLAVDFIEKVDEFMDAGLSMQRTLLYFVYKLPLVIYQITPVATLLAVLITFGIMSKHNELVALRSGGVSLLRLVGPIARCGLAATALVLLMAEGVAPLTLSQANRIWWQEVRGEQITTTRQQDIWLKGEQSIVHLKYYQPDRQVARGITVHWFDRSFRLARRIDARVGRFDAQQGRWRLQNGMEQVAGPQGTPIAAEPFDERWVVFDFTPDDLARSAPRTEEMSFAQLRRYVQRVTAEGYDATHYEVDMHAKIAFPFVCLIMTLMGAALAARGNIRDGLAISVTYGLGIIFVYWIVFSFCISLGYAAMLPPLIAAWGVNFISACVVGFMLLNAE